MSKDNILLGVILFVRSTCTLLSLTADEAPHYLPSRDTQLLVTMVVNMNITKAKSTRHLPPTIPNPESYFRSNGQKWRNQNVIYGSCLSPWSHSPKYSTITDVSLLLRNSPLPMKMYVLYGVYTTLARDKPHVLGFLACRCRQQVTTIQEKRDQHWSHPPCKVLASFDFSRSTT